MKVKHNKKRNTAFIFEALIRELSKSILKHDKKRRTQINSIIREHFTKGAPLDEELQCYTALAEKSNLDTYTAEKMIYRSRTLHESINKGEIFAEQSRVISKINKQLGGAVFSNFVPNYKLFATISQLFNKKTPLNQKVILEKQILETLVATPTSEPRTMHPLDDLVIKSFAQNFNTKYASLLPEQQALLGKYAVAIGTNEVDFRLAVGEELKRLRTEVEQSLRLDEVASDSEMVTNTKKVLEQISEFNVSHIGEKEFKKILKLQELVREYHHDAS